MPNKLDEILKNLISRLQTTSQTQSLELTPVRRKVLMIFFKVDKLVKKYTKHQTWKGLIDTVVRPHIEGLIKKEIPENELRQVLKDCYEETKDIYFDLDIATELKNTPTDKSVNDIVKNLPKYKELAELL